MLLLSLLGLVIILHSSKIFISNDVVRIKKPLGTYSMNWKEITSVEFGNGNLVFFGENNKRMTAPSSQYWKGKTVDEFSDFFYEKLEENNIPVSQTFRANFPGCKNTKI
jgi:hypothetical protein